MNEHKDHKIVEANMFLDVKESKLVAWAIEYAIDELEKNPAFDVDDEWYNDRTILFHVRDRLNEKSLKP